MSSKNQIDRATKTLIDGIKDAVDTNLVSAVRSKQIDIKPEHLSVLLALVNASIQEGYIKGSRVFTRTVTDSIAASQAPATPTKKKTA